MVLNVRDITLVRNLLTRIHRDINISSIERKLIYKKRASTSTIAITGFKIIYISRDIWQEPLL